MGSEMCIRDRLSMYIKQKKVARNASGVPMVALDAMPKKVTPTVVAANTSINSTSKYNCGSPNRRAAVFWKLYNA